MFKKILYMGVFCLAGCVLSQPAWSADSLSTQDKTCKFNYLTAKNTSGWYITTSPDLCQNGWVQGHGEVTIYNAFSKPVEQIYGFFNGGYWTGEMALNAPILSETVDDKGTRKVFYALFNETGLDFDLIGQMTAQKQKDGTYAPFKFCDPFRVLVKTNEKTLFKDQEVITEIIDTVAKQTRDICPPEKKILLFGAEELNPLPQDVFFYAQIDLQTAKIDVKRNQAFEGEKHSYGTPADRAAPNLDDLTDEMGETPLDDLSDDMLTPDEIQASHPAQTAGDLGVVMTGEDIITPVPKQLPSDNNSVQKNIPAPSVSYPDLQEDASNLEKRALVQPQPYDLSSRGLKDPSIIAPMTIDPREDSVPILPSLQEIQEGADVLNLLDKIPHLLVTSKVLQRPVLGAAVVYIASVKGDDAIATKPTFLQLKGRGLQAGWAVIAGNFIYRLNADKGINGIVQVSSVVPCQAEYCKDIK